MVEFQATRNTTFQKVYLELSPLLSLLISIFCVLSIIILSTSVSFAQSSPTVSSPQISSPPETPLSTNGNGIQPIFSTRILSSISSDQDSEGNQFRLSVMRRSQDSRSNVNIVVEQINYGDKSPDKVLSQLVLTPDQLKHGEETVVSFISFEGNSFFFTQEHFSNLEKSYDCHFDLPTPPVKGPISLLSSQVKCTDY